MAAGSTATRGPDDAPGSSTSEKATGRSTCHDFPSASAQAISAEKIQALPRISLKIF
jgi:hypothetical protein